jgi:hypothetical protein
MFHDGFVPIGKLISVDERGKWLTRVDPDGLYHSPNIAFVDTPATAWSDIMTKLVNNQGGQVESLPEVRLLGGKVCQQVSTITLAAQASGTVIHVARIPKGSVIRSIDVITDTSLGSTTVKFGDAHSGNSAIYGAAATLTATDTLTRFGPPTATFGVPIDTCYDYAGNGPLTAQLPSPYGAGQFEDVLMITGAATAPASGTVKVAIAYVPPA